MGSVIRIATFLVLAGVANLILPSSLASADTLARLMPVANQAMITVFKGRVSADDSDGKFLFDSMNVPPQGSFLGPGKLIADSGKFMSWTCGDRGADGHQCTFMIQQSSFTKISFSPLKISFEITGAEAQNLFDQITPNTSSTEFKFTNVEGTLSLNATSGHFLLTYHE